MIKTNLLIILLAIVSLGTTGLMILRVKQSHTPPASTSHAADKPGPPVLLTLPLFNLTERSGQPLDAATLQGKVWIANFVFTRCQGPCPMMISRMAQLQIALQNKPGWDQIRLVSISVDPTYDTPAVLAKRAKMAMADPTHWLWLTGKRPKVWSLIHDGFKLPVSDNQPDDEGLILHSQKFVLVDRQMRVRGYYDALTGPGQKKLLRDLRVLLASGK